MAPPKVHQGAPSPVTTRTATEEIADVATDRLLEDPKLLEDTEYRKTHQDMFWAIDVVNGYFKKDGSVNDAMLKSAIEDWVKSSANDPIQQKVIAKLRQTVTGFQAAETAELAKKVSTLLPAPPQDAANPDKKTPPRSSSEEVKNEQKPDALDQYLNVGVSLGNDTAMLQVFDWMRLPVSALAAEKQIVSVRPSVEFPFKGHVGVVRLGFGAYFLRGVPNGEINASESTDSGTGYRASIDLGLVNPNSKSHSSAGVGLELDGILSGASSADGQGVAPVSRMHFWSQDELIILDKYTGNFQFGLTLPLMSQETYVTLGNGDPLVRYEAPPPPENPTEDDIIPTLKGQTFAQVGTNANLFAKNPIRWFSLSGRYYPKGKPTIPEEGGKRPLTDGEGSELVASLLPNAVIQTNRSQDVAAFANDQVYLGAFIPFGEKGSRDQFNTISLGLAAYSLQDGWLMASNSAAQAKIWRDGTWLHRGLMLGVTALRLAWHGGGTAAAKGDPSPNPTIEEFAKNPGSVTDFVGRGHKMDLPLLFWEGGLTLLDASNALGNKDSLSDPNLDPKTKEALRDYHRYTAVGVGLVGLAGFVFSGPFTGNGCGPDGAVLACSFFGASDRLFKKNKDYTPDDIASIERQYIVSNLGSSTFLWGAKRVIDTIGNNETPAPSSTKSQVGSAISPVNFNVSVTPVGFFVGASGSF